jgi:hypothetical protein
MEAAGSSEKLVTIRLHGVTYGNLHMTAMGTCLFLYSKWLVGSPKFGLCASLKEESGSQISRGMPEAVVHRSFACV